MTQRSDKQQQREAEKLVLELMAIPGKSGQEGRVSARIQELLGEAGANPDWIKTDNAHRRSPLVGECGNLVLKLPGNQRGPRRLLSAHLDTVPICVGSKPKVQGRRVSSTDPSTGLGADNRAGCAVILQAAVQILRQDLPHPPLTFCWFVQEEVGLQGARCVTKRLLGNPRLAFNWDGGSATKLTIGATGGYRMDIEVCGLASHAGGAPEWGVSAITIAGIAMADLHRNGWHGAVHKGRRFGTSNVGYIHGGEATNVVTDRVVLRAEARSHNASFREKIQHEIVKAFEKAAKEVTNAAGAQGSVQFSGRLDYEAFRLADDQPCVALAEEAVGKVGGEPVRVIANGGLDANWLTAHGIPTVSMGCGQLHQHMATEALDLDEYGKACRIALLLGTEPSTQDLNTHES